MYFVLVPCVFAICANFVSGHRCTLPNGDEGICKSLADCDVLTKMTKKLGRSSQDYTFLGESKCSLDDDIISEVCCPKSETISCITPDNFEGQCVSLQSCPHLIALAKDSTEMKKYVCAGPEEDSVCCGPAEIYMTPKEMECHGNATSFPPDPMSECCGLDDSFQNKIFGGNDTAIDEYPWMAVIEYVKKNDRLLLCGGTLISNRYVLTAAHCVKGPILFIGTPKFVRLGEYNVANRGPDCVYVEDGEDDCTDGALIAPIHKTVVHPQFRPYHNHRRYDIGLIRLEIIVPYTAYIRPICLPSMDYTISPPKELILTIAGWGTYELNITANIYYTSDKKQHVDVPYVDRQKCQESIQKRKQNPKSLLYEGQICAGGVLGKDSCNADSGGPLMYEQDRMFEIIGIVSFGSGICGLKDVPGVYTHVYDYIPWIKTTIKP